DEHQVVVHVAANATVVNANSTLSLHDALPISKDEVEEYKKIDPITQVFDVIKENNWATDEEIETIGNRVRDLVSECEKFAEESPYPETNVMYDVVYDQEDYPFIPHKL